MKIAIIATFVLMALSDIVFAGSTPVISIDSTRSSSVDGFGNFPQVLQNSVQQNPNSLLNGLVNSSNGTQEQVQNNVINNLTNSNIINGSNDSQVIFNQLPPFGGTLVSPNNAGQVPPIVIPPINF